MFQRLLAFIVAAVKDDQGSVSSRRIGYLGSVATLCIALLYIAGMMGYVVIEVPLDRSVADLPQLVNALEVICGILSGAVTAGYVFKKDDGLKKGDGKDDDSNQ